MSSFHQLNLIQSPVEEVPITEKAGLMRSMNEGISLFAADGPTWAGEMWVFVCECGAADCDASLDLALADYEAIRAEAGGTVLAAGHVAPSSAEPTRREAADTQELARALHEQAKLRKG
jgi:hypothetical protein